MYEGWTTVKPVDQCLLGRTFLASDKVGRTPSKVRGCYTAPLFYTYTSACASALPYCFAKGHRFPHRLSVVLTPLRPFAAQPLARRLWFRIGLHSLGTVAVGCPSAQCLRQGAFGLSSSLVIVAFDCWFGYVWLLCVELVLIVDRNCWEVPSLRRRCRCWCFAPCPLVVTIRQLWNSSGLCKLALVWLDYSMSYWMNRLIDLAQFTVNGQVLHNQSYS